jgi:hypothetical protein
MDSRTSSNIKGPTMVLSEETTKSELKIIRFDPTMNNKNISIVVEVILYLPVTIYLYKHS